MYTSNTGIHMCVFVTTCKNYSGRLFRGKEDPEGSSSQAELQGTEEL